MTWTEAQFDADIGTVVSRRDGFTVGANRHGQILVRVPADGLILAAEQQLTVSFVGRAPSTMYVLWRLDDSEEVFEYGLRPQDNSGALLNMHDVAGWDGPASSLQLGFIVKPGQQLTLRKLSIITPGFADRFVQAWENWRSFRPWMPWDINLYSGAQDQSRGPYPAKTFALSIAFFTICYLLLRRTRARWSEGALLILVPWMLLDGFWQLRLWEQLSVTRERYAGLSSEAKISASENARLAGFVESSRASAGSQHARVFVASSSDYNGMHAAYYLSPMNTYWNRFGEELPQAEYFRPGDKVLIVAPSTINYDRQGGRIRLPLGGELSVVEVYAAAEGVFLRVTQ